VIALNRCGPDGNTTWPFPSWSFSGQSGDLLILLLPAGLALLLLLLLLPALLVRP
jgi:hypothetical protein